MIAGATIALVACAAVVLLWAAWPQRQRLAWALTAISGLALYLGLRALPSLVPGPQNLGTYWNWSGHFLALGGMLLLAALLVRRAQLDWRAFGFAGPVAPGVAVAVAAAALLLNFAINAVTGSRLHDIPAETWLFLATMPGLVEEVAFRGVLLAAAERAAPASRVIAGVRLTAGALVLTLAFVALHGPAFGTLVSVLPAALLYLWLRLKTGSVIVPVVAHNLWNLSVIAAHL